MRERVKEYINNNQGEFLKDGDGEKKKRKQRHKRECSERKTKGDYSRNVDIWLIHLINLTELVNKEHSLMTLETFFEILSKLTINVKMFAKENVTLNTTRFNGM